MEQLSTVLMIPNQVLMLNNSYFSYVVKENSMRLDNFSSHSFIHNFFTRATYLHWNRCFILLHSSNNKKNNVYNVL